MEVLSALSVEALNGGGTGASQLVGYVTKGSSFPTTRMNGSPLQQEDYVKVDANTPAEDFPFTISGITFTNRKDKAIYIGTNRWMLDAGAIQFTNETPTANKTAESLNENGTTQAQVNLQVANMIGRKKSLSVSDKTNIIDALNFAWQELKKAGYGFELTETDTDNLRSMVLTIKDYNNTVIYTKTLGDFVLEGRKVADCDLADDITPQEIQDAIKNLTATLTNKTIDADDNTVLNIETDNFKADVVKEILSAICTNKQIPTAKAVWDAVYTAGMNYSTMTSLDDIFTTLSVPEKGAKCGYITNLIPAQTAGASKAAGYIRASVNTADYKMLEFFPWSDGRRWWVLKNNGTWGDWQSDKKYKHLFIYYNSTTFEYPLCWWEVVNDKPTYTLADFKTFLTENGYTVATNTYTKGAGGITGTMTVSTPSGTGIVGSVFTGAYMDGTTLKFKVNFSGWATPNEAKLKIETTNL